jgi:hypothetical protein
MKIRCKNLDPLTLGNRKMTMTGNVLTLDKEYEVLGEQIEQCRDKYTGQGDGIDRECYTIVVDDGRMLNCLKERFEVVDEIILGQRKIKKNAKNLE